MKWVFILALTVFHGNGNDATTTFKKVYGNNYWDAYRICEVAGKSMLRRGEDNQYDGFWCEPAKENPQF